MATTIQMLHSLTAGHQPGDLVPGELAYNVADGFMYLGNGSSVYTDTLGNVIGPSIQPGGGWQQAVYNATPVNGSVTLAGIYDAQSNLITAVTAAGTAAGFAVGALPPADPSNDNYYVLVQIGGVLTAPAPVGETADPGDWIVSTGIAWSLVAQSNVSIPAENVTVTPTGPLTGPNMQQVLNQIQLTYLEMAGGAISFLNVNGNLDVYGSTSLGNDPTDTTTVTGNATFNNNVTVTGNFTANGNVVLGNSSLDTITLTGTVAVGGSQTISQNLTVQGNTVLGNNTASDTVTVNAVSTFGGGVTLSGTLNANGASTFTNTIGVTGTAKNVTFTGSGTIDVGNGYNVVVRGDLATSGNTTIGDTSADTLTVGATTVFNGATNTFTGVTNLSGTNVLSGATSYDRPGSLSAQSLNQFLVIPGTIIQFAQTGSTPAGYLWCDGSSYNTADYPDLFAVINYRWGGSGGTFKVPDLRGMFIRGAQATPNYTTALGQAPNGGVVGTCQKDSYQSHNHNLWLNTTGYCGTQFNSQREVLTMAQGQMNSQQRPNNGTIGVDYGGNTVQYGAGFPAVQNSGSGTETKPVSASVEFFIKF